MWVDVAPRIPRPVLAHNAEQGPRRVEARLWYILAEDRPFKLEIALIKDGAQVETWHADYASRDPSGAHRGYASAQRHADRWLEGWPVTQIRPGFVRPK